MNDSWQFNQYVSYDAHEVITPDGSVNVRGNFMCDLTESYIIKAIVSGEYEQEWDFLTQNIDGIWCQIHAIVTFYPNGRV